MSKGYLDTDFYKRDDGKIIVKIFNLSADMQKLELSIDIYNKLYLEYLAKGLIPRKVKSKTIKIQSTQNK